MKKLRLEDLAVNSFATSGRTAGRGTVRGYDSEVPKEDLTDETGTESGGECSFPTVPRSAACSYILTICWNMSCAGRVC